MTIKNEVRGDVVAYRLGKVVSACAPFDLCEPEVESAINFLHPTGLASRWSIEEEAFSDGSLNGSACEMDDGRRHWLLTC